MSLILGSGYGFVLILLYNSIRFARDLRAPSGLLIVKAGKAHSDLLLIFQMIPSPQSLLTSCLNFSSLDLGTG
jgi:hypothetical protein